MVKVLKELPKNFQKPNRSHHSYFVKLTEQDLQEFGKFVGASGSCYQKITSQSIVVTDTKKYWKFIVRDKDAFAVTSAMPHMRNFKHVVKYKTIKHCNHLFETPAKLPNLKPDQAKSCLFDLSKLISVALKALHKLHYAHLDVRLQMSVLN